jgi:hypothetical protein
MKELEHVGRHALTTRSSAHQPAREKLRHSDTSSRIVRPECALFLSPCRGRAGRPRRKENVARLDRHLTGRLLENKPSGRIDRLKRAFDRLQVPRHADPCAKTGGEREPFGADRFESGARGPNIEPMCHRRGKPREHSCRRDRLASDRREIGCFGRRIGGMQAAVHADPGDAREAPIGEICTFQQYSAKLGAVMENIVRPFDRNPPIPTENLTQRVSRRDTRNKAEFRGPVRRRRIEQ